MFCIVDVEGVLVEDRDVVGLNQLVDAVQVVVQTFYFVALPCFFSEGERNVNDVRARRDVAERHCKQLV